MKKKLLFASLLLAGTSFGQGLTQANEPAIGTSVDMFLCDSFATNYANITGTGAVWDYSAIAGFQGELRNLTIVDPTTTTNTADFPSATKAVVVENFLTTYWSSTATERNSPGFVFYEPTFGEVKAIFNLDPQTLANYEFAYNDELSDIFSGSLYFSFSGLPQNPDATGTSFSKIDGEGTLKLNAATTLTGVIRCVTIDTLNTNVPIVGDIQLIRAQYEYYKLSAGSMPVFTHTSAKIIGSGSVDPLTEFTVVLSSVQPDNFVSVDETEKINFSIFPNPAKESLTIKGDFNGAIARIIDQTGKTVQTIESVTSGMTVQLNDIQKGIYFLELTVNGVSKVEKFSKN
jgi:hypothetical protein